VTRGSQHLRSLTSLRFFAAAVVVLYHATIRSSPDLRQPYALLSFGHLGVAFFFVLSGFVLVWSARDGDRAMPFYRRRFARVWPLHALTFVLAAGLGVAGLIDAVGPAWSAPLNLALLQAWSTDGEVLYGYNSVSWSLSAEAFFYLLFPALLLLARRVGPVATVGLGAAWLVVAGVAADMIGYGVHALPLYRVGEFVFGMGLALLVRRGIPRISPAFAVSALVASYALLVVLDRISAGGLLARAWVAVLIVLPGIALVLVAFARRDIDGGEGALTHPVLVRLGAWSFALYMVHELVLRVARPVMLDHGWTVPVMIVVSVLLSGLLFEWFERPVEKKLRGRGRPAVQLEPAAR
jgi:peptidoglycan/LPS O-acetylase OafA/YrhL